MVWYGFTLVLVEPNAFEVANLGAMGAPASAKPCKYLLKTLKSGVRPQIASQCVKWASMESVAAILSHNGWHGLGGYY